MIIDKDGAADTIMLESRKGSVKVQMIPLQPKTLTHLPNRPKVDLAFTDLKYTVRQGKGESESSFKPNSRSETHNGNRAVIVTSVAFIKTCVRKTHT